MSINNKYISAVILAAGAGTRMKSDITKQRIEILGESVLKRSVRAFEECDAIDSITVVAKEDELSVIRGMLSSGFCKLYDVVAGGECRADSARHGFLAIPNNTDYVAIHDAARCLVTPDMIRRVVVSAIEHGAATASCRVTDTVKRVDSDSMIIETLPRSELVTVQTPQIFERALYEKSVETCVEKLFEFTDDNMLVEKIGGRIHCVDTGSDNIKITTQKDLLLAEFILEKRK